MWSVDPIRLLGAVLGVVFFKIAPWEAFIP